MIFKHNLALLCDFYEFIMSNGYFKSGKKDQICYFDLFFRKIPDKGEFAIFAGLESILSFIENLHFEKEDIEFLRKQGLFSEEFLEFLSTFKFSGEIYALNEGEVIFPDEPLLCIKAKTIEAQLLETFLLLSINHQSLIATKANRIVKAAKGREVFEFGARRAHGINAALEGARAAIIGGFKASSCTLAGKIYNIKMCGTMAHSWVQMFQSEFEAFCEYLRLYPKNPVLLIDTYDVNLGLKNAIKAFKKFGIKDGGVRIDSGNLAKLSKEIREKLDLAGLKRFKIIVSNSLDEKSIKALLKAPIDGFGVGERLITASNNPIFGCVYKLVASEEKGLIKPKIKISEDSQKTINPHFKRLFRIYDKNSKQALYDKLCVYDEELKLSANLESKELLSLVFKDGKRTQKPKSLEEIQNYSKEQLLKFKPLKKYELKLSNKLKKLKGSLKESRF